MGGFVFLIIVGIVIYNIVKSGQAKQANWKVAAENLGLGYIAGDFGLGGKILGRKGGHRVEVSTFTKRSGDSSRTYTKYRIEYHARIPVDFKITREKALHRLGQAFGMVDIEVGNSSFDHSAVVRGVDAERVRKFLSPARQEAILRLVDSYNDVVITNEHIELRKSGKDGNSAVIIRTVRVLLSVCNELTDDSQSVAEEARSIETVEPAPMSGFEPPVPPPAPPAPEIIEPAFNPLVSADPVVVVPPDVPELPENKAVGGIDDPAEPESSIPAAATVEEAVEAIAPEPFSTLNLRQVAEALYGGPTANSLQAARMFDEQFKEHPVEGAGTIKRVSKFSYDLVFPNAEGVKASLQICEIAGPYSKVKVTAEVMFPPEDYDMLKAKVGQRLTVSGKLIAQDAMMTQLYIMDT